MNKSYVLLVVSIASQTVYSMVPLARATLTVVKPSTLRVQPVRPEQFNQVDFQALPQKLQDAHQKKSYPGAKTDIAFIVHLVQNRKEYPLDFTVLLPFYVWRMIQNQGISHKTAEHILDNLKLLSLHKPMQNDVGLDWEEEHHNKLELIEKINCLSVQESCKQDPNHEYSITLQEFIYGLENPYTSIVWDGPFMRPGIVQGAAREMGCWNPEAFDKKRPGLTYHEECNHKFCIE